MKNESRFGSWQKGGKVELLVGKRIGTLYIVGQDESNVYGYCCNCRNNITYSYEKINELINKDELITCGCEIEEEIEEEIEIEENLIGTQYNKLTIVKQINEEEIECRCECGSLLKTKLDELENKNISMCKECKIVDNVNKAENEYKLQGRYRKELYYIWSSYKNLYINPTPEFKKNIIKNNIRFFPDLEKYENAFEMFYEWAIIWCEQQYGENGKVALVRIDESKDFSRDNCLWIYQDLDKYKYVTLGKDNIDIEKESYYEDGIYYISTMKEFCRSLFICT